MKKSIICMGIILGCLNVRASVVTNWVYVVSNIFHNVYHESIVTQKVKSSHTDYYFTNYVSVVTNVYQSTFNTNIDMTVVFDNFDPWVSAASNSAASAALSADSASGYADSARIYSSQASTYANNAYSYQVGTINAANSGLAQINDRIDWFIEHSGEQITMNITNIDVSVTTNMNVSHRSISVDYAGEPASPHSEIYTNTVSGTVWPKITTHPYGADGGATLLPYGTESYAGINIEAWPYCRATTHTWTFIPAYIDSDDKGMRLQYVPQEIINIPYADNNHAYPDGKIVPEYLYWQDGYLYFKVNVWTNGVIAGWCKSRNSYNAYPRPINYGTATGVGIDLEGRSKYGNSGTVQYGGWYHHISRGSSFTFPRALSPALWPTVDWMKNGPWQ